MCKNYNTSSCDVDIEKVILSLAAVGGAIYAVKNIWGGLVFLKNKTVEVASSLNKQLQSNNSQLKQIQSDVAEIKKKVNAINPQPSVNKE